MLFQDEKGEWHILDYKTTSGDEDAARKSAYDLQIRIYALAAYKVLGIPVRSGIIFYLKNSREVTVNFSEKEKAGACFAEIEKQVCDLQGKVLDFSKQRTRQG